MSCLEFRRALLAWPSSTDPPLTAHRQECAECDAFGRRQAAFERTLGQAVKLEVPDGLSSRVLLDHSLHVGAESRRRRRYLGFAASVVLGLALAWLGMRPGRLDLDVFAHIDAERVHLADRRDLSRAQVNEKLAPLGITLESDVGPIHYAGACPIRRRMGGHLVLQGAKGPVTVFFLPGEVAASPIPIHDAEFRGIIVPAGRGSMAIVGEPGERLDDIERLLRRSVRFGAERDA